ncbi:ABC transporter ATP-binding protein, partial [Akkermansia sp.]|uniref:ABC transporter ATP-binding protein n=1 Tax=Akkermansia sp. TaxID=1872421 RepID=UPI0025C7230D
MLTVRNLSASFHTRAGIVRAVRNVSFDVAPGETLGIVGESGSGKSVTCYSMMGLIPMPPGRIESGSAMLDGTDLLHCPEKELRSIRGKRISMIFQDPMTSLNPYLTIGEQVAEPLVIHEGAGKKEARDRALEQLALVGIPDAEQRMDAYPHQFSGGMRQRVMIAMALITRPEILIADEPTTALDVTVQKQVLDLIRKLQQDMGTSVILITHDLGVVRQYADRINVMYAGRIVESAPARELLEHPRHAYTRALMKSIPGLHAKCSPLYTIPGLPPNMMQEPCGCSFRPRNTLGNPE